MIIVYSFLILKYSYKPKRKYIFTDIKYCQYGPAIKKTNIQDVGFKKTYNNGILIL